jgi:O-acetyl-ADP-ribose deacetylase (regulator of RNase III)
LQVQSLQGNLLNQDVEVIINAWNRNIIPWWLLLPQGVSGQIKKFGGIQLFREVAKQGAIQLGGAVLTGAGKLNFKGIIHVAGINMFWRASEKSIRGSVANAMKIVNEKEIISVAFPIIGAGSGSFNTAKAKLIMLDEFAQINSDAKILSENKTEQSHGAIKHRTYRHARRGQKHCWRSAGQTAGPSVCRYRPDDSGRRGQKPAAAHRNSGHAPLLRN